MFSSNTIKFFSALLLLLGCQSCSYWRGQTNATPVPTPFVAEELKSEIPFSTKEPDVYQTEIVITGASGFEEKTFAAKNGANRLLIVDFQAKTEIALLQLGESQNFTIARNQKIYAENKYENTAAKSEPLNDFLNVELINRKTGAKFETLGAENNLGKYRVNLDDSINSEMIIYVNEKIGLPTRQEFYSIGGERKILTLTMELRNFNLHTDAGIFEVPKNYRQVSPKEFQETMQRERMK